MTEAPNAETFTPHIGNAVSLLDGHLLTLVAVDQRSSLAPGAEPRTAFSLLLRGPSARIVPEGMHRLILEGGASFDLYLIPVHTASRDHQDYQIIFN